MKMEASEIDVKSYDPFDFARASNAELRKMWKNGTPYQRYMATREMMVNRGDGEEMNEHALRNRLQLAIVVRA